MRRREFITVLASAAILPRVAHAQQTAQVRRIGILLVGLSPDSKAVRHFLRGLGEAGYVVGRDLLIEWRFASGDYSLLPKLVSDLIQHRVDAIVVDSTVATSVAKRSTSTTPIVMALVLDPVGSGLVNSLGQPGGNVTGLSMMTSVSLNLKRLQLLKEVIPTLTRAAVIWSPDHPLHVKSVEELQAIAPSLSIELIFASVRVPEQFDPAFVQINRAQAQALYVIDDPFFWAQRKTLLNLASAAQLPTIHDLRRWPEEGALMSYGPDLHDLFRRAASYVDRILKGAKPADLPVEQPTKFELLINLKTANALGITVPLTVQAQADEVIE
jgi:putative ABC transport system substrate-binding protein